MEDTIHSKQPNTLAAAPGQTSENQYTETMNTETMNRDNQYIEQIDQLQQNAPQRFAKYTTGDTDVCYTKEPCAGLPQTVSPEPLTSLPGPSPRAAGHGSAADAGPSARCMSLLDLPDKTPEEMPQYARILLRGKDTSQAVLLIESPHNKTKCAEWRSAEELARKPVLLALLYEGKTPAAVAKYVNCSVQQVYRAMHYHGIPTKRIYRRSGIAGPADAGCRAAARVKRGERYLPPDREG